MALRPHEEALPASPQEAFGLPLSIAAAESIAGRRRPEDFRWRYEDGLALYAVSEAGFRRGRPELSGYAEAAMRHLVSPEGSIAGYREDEYNLDQVNPGKLLFGLAKRTGEQRWMAAADLLRRQLENQPRCPSGGFWHKGIYPNQMWLDGLYMAAPFYLEYSLVRKDAKGVADVVSQFCLAEKGCLDAGSGLLRHAWNETRSEPWAEPGTGRSPNFWGRAMGWYAMALVDSLALLSGCGTGAGTFPEAREALLGIFRRVMAAVVAHADRETGLWWQVLDASGREGNYLETSASAMFIYALARGARLGLLDPGACRAPAEKAWASMVSRNVSRAGDGFLTLGGICSVAGLGGRPYRDGSYQYYLSEPVVSDDFKGVGPFVLAALEMEDLGKGDRA